MTIDVSRHPNGRVTENFTYHLKFHAGGKHQRCSGVTKLVRVPVSETRLFADLTELPIEVPRIDRSSDRRGEDKPGINPCVP